MHTTPPNLPVGQYQDLVCDWLMKLCNEQGIFLSRNKVSADEFLFFKKDEPYIRVLRSKDEPYIHFFAINDGTQEFVDKLVSKAKKCTHLRSQNGLKWYCAFLSQTDGNSPIIVGPSNFSRQQDFIQPNAGVNGWRRLGPIVLLDFCILYAGQQRSPDFTPTGKRIIHHLPPKTGVRIFVPTPSDEPEISPDLYINYICEIMEAVCTFTLGKPMSLDPSISGVSFFLVFRKKNIF